MNHFLKGLTIVLLSWSSLFAYGRGSSAPYVSGDTFRFNCDHIHDELVHGVDPSRVKDGETIFVKTDFLDHFFTRIHPYINARYILVTHNSDYTVPSRFESYLDDDKLIAWFGQNVENCSHPKMHHIPIGIANRCWPHGDISIVSQVAILQSDDREILLYMNFAPGSYPQERVKVANMFKDKPYCYVANIKGYRDYLRDLTHAKFVLSPRGNGPDCHRTWDSLLMGAIPIVKSSSLDPMFENMPVLIIQDWEEINKEFLEEKYVEIMSKSYDYEKIYSDYWLQLIDSYRNE